MNPSDSLTDLLQLCTSVKANIFKGCVSGAIDIVWPIKSCALDLAKSIDLFMERSTVVALIDC